VSGSAADDFVERRGRRGAGAVPARLRVDFLDDGDFHVVVAVGMPVRLVRRARRSLTLARMGIALRFSTTDCTSASALSRVARLAVNFIAGVL
jgi:hypothetical protein